MQNLRWIRGIRCFIWDRFLCREVDGSRWPVVQAPQSLGDSFGASIACPWEHSPLGRNARLCTTAQLSHHMGWLRQGMTSGKRLSKAEAHPKELTAAQWVFPWRVQVVPGKAWRKGLWKEMDAIWYPVKSWIWVKSWFPPYSTHGPEAVHLTTLCLSFLQTQLRVQESFHYSPDTYGLGLYSVPGTVPGCNSEQNK